MTPQQKKKSQAPKKNSLIYIRNLDKNDNDMLATLKSLNGFGKSNATNVMRASFKFLELLTEVKILKQQIRKLEDDNGRKDNVYHEIKSEILSIIGNEIESNKALAKQKAAFYSSLKKTGKKIPKTLQLRSSKRFFIDWLNELKVNIETGTYQMRDGKIIVVTAIIKREVTIKQLKNNIVRVPRALKDDKVIIVFRDLEKHPFSNDLEYMTAKTFSKRVRINSTMDQGPLLEKVKITRTMERGPLVEKI